MEMTIRMSLKVFASGLCLLGWGLLSAAARELPPVQASYPKTLNGEEMFQFFRSDEWDVSAEFRDGKGTNATFFQDGRIAAVNLQGGGPLDGKWNVKVDESLLCVQWERVDWSSEGCFRLVQTGPVNFELREPESGEWNWKFKVLNY